MRSISCAKRSKRCGTAAAPKPSPGVSSTSRSRISLAELAGSASRRETLAARLAALAEPAETLGRSREGTSRSSVARTLRACLFWAEARGDRSPAISATGRVSTISPTSDWLRRRQRGARNGIGDGVRFPARRGAHAPVGRLRRPRRRAGRELLRPAGLGSAPGELHRHRQGRLAGAALVPARAWRRPGRRRRGLAVLVGLDVRISDAVAGHARAGRKHPRADQSR